MGEVASSVATGVFSVVPAVFFSPPSLLIFFVSGPFCHVFFSGTLRPFPQRVTVTGKIGLPIYDLITVTVTDAAGNKVVDGTTVYASSATTAGGVFLTAIFSALATLAAASACAFF